MDIVVTAAFGALAILAAWGYDARWKVPLPPLGVFDYSDVAVLGVVVVVYPLMGAVEASWLAAVINGALILNAVADLTAPMRTTRTLRAVALLAIAALLVLLATSHPGPIPAWVVTDVLLLTVVVAVAVTWAQLGATLNHLAVLAALLTVYDITATWLTGFMHTFVRTLAQQPLPFVFTFPASHGASSLGVGDILMLTLIPVIARRRMRPRPALGAALLTYGGYLGGLAIAASHPGSAIPLMITLGPVTVAIAVWAAVHDTRPARQRPARRSACVHLPYNVAAEHSPAPV